MPERRSTTRRASTRIAAWGSAVAVVGGGLILILALLAWPKPKTLGLYILLGLLAVPVQPFLASSGVHHKLVGMLHPVNALLLLGLSGYLAHRAWAPRHPVAAEAPAAG